MVKSLKQGKSLAQKRRRLIKKDGQDVGQEKSNNSLYLVIRQVGYLLVILINLAVRITMMEDNHFLL